jgi:hypothetical protein
MQHQIQEIHEDRAEPEAHFVDEDVLLFVSHVTKEDRALHQVVRPEKHTHRRPAQRNVPIVVQGCRLVPERENEAEEAIVVIVVDHAVQMRVSHET